MTAFLGIDVAKRTLDLVLLNGTSQVATQVSNDASGLAQLTAWLAAQQAGPVHACLEATGRYGWAAAHWLVQAGHRVSLVNPRVIAAFADVLASRTKTDRLDAALLARYCQLHQPPAWLPPDPARLRLQQLSRHLDALEQMRQQERNRLQAGHVDAFIQRVLVDHLAYLDGQIQALQAEIEQHIQQQPALAQPCQLLDSIDGIGFKTASRVLAELPDLSRLRHARQLVAYAGLNPRQHRSGSSVHQATRISKRGNARLRTALFFAAIAAKNHSLYFRPFVQRLQAAGHAPLSIVVAVMRKLLHLIFGVLKHRQPFDPNYLTKKALAT